MRPNPKLDATEITQIWQLCDRVMGLLEEHDGNRIRANTFFTEFMKEKEAGDLMRLLEKYVDVS